MVIVVLCCLVDNSIFINDAVDAHSAQSPSRISSAIPESLNIALILPYRV
jgi:hypothetical protein